MPGGLHSSFRLLNIPNELLPSLLLPFPVFLASLSPSTGSPAQPISTPRPTRSIVAPSPPKLTTRGAPIMPFRDSARSRRARSSAPGERRFVDDTDAAENMRDSLTVLPLPLPVRRNKDLNPRKLVDRCGTKTVVADGCDEKEDGPDCMLLVRECCIVFG